MLQKIYQSQKILLVYFFLKEAKSIWIGEFLCGFFLIYFWHFCFCFFANCIAKKMVFRRFSINFFGNFVSQAIRYSFILEYKYSFGVFVFCGYWKTNLYNNQQNLQKKAHFLDDYFLYYQCFTIPVQG